MDASSQFIVPTIIDVPELIVTNEDLDYDETSNLGSSVWFSKLHFLASASSYIINLGNVLRFPHLCYKYGGGAFLLAYTTCSLTVGLPLLLMELAFGQYANEGPITIWRISPAFEGLGYSMCIISAMIAIYYNILNCWILQYLLASITFRNLPWTGCDNGWNTNQCFLKSNKPTLSTNEKSNCTTTLDETNPSSNASILYAENCSKLNIYEFERTINSSDQVSLPANEYFHNNILEISGSITELGSFNWSILFGLVLIWLALFFAISKGVRLNYSNRIALILFILPILASTALFICALSLPGSYDGIVHYLSIDWLKLQNIDIWADATTQIFFSILVCWGQIISLANMNKFHNNFHTDAILIYTVNYACSVYFGLIAFSILGYTAKYSGIAIGEVADIGLGFIFLIVPEGLSRMPLANLNSTLFFAILLYTGFTNQLTLFQTLITTIIDTWPHKLRYRKPLILMILCSIMFTLGLSMCFGNGFYVLQLLDSFAGTYTAMIVGILELIAIAWVYGVDNFIQDIDDMISAHKNLHPSRSYWDFMWRYLAPSVLFSILLFCFIDLPVTSYRGIENPAWTLKFGWIMTFASLLMIPAVACIRFLLCPSGSFIERVSYLCRPSEDWAPSSYVSGPKLLNKHMMEDREFDEPLTGFSSNRQNSNHQPVYIYEDQDHNRSEDDSNDDIRVIDGKSNYIIPEEEEDDTDTGLITSETNM